jgi:hypothetical protein
MKMGNQLHAQLPLSLGNNLQRPLDRRTGRSHSNCGYGSYEKNHNTDDEIWTKDVQSTDCLFTKQVTFTASDPYAALLNPSTPSYERPICWALCFSVLMRFAQRNTLQNTWNFLLHTYLVRLFVASKPISTPQYVAVCIFCGKLWNTHQ